MADPAFNPLYIVVPAIGFAIFRRLRTSFGAQRLLPARMIIRMVLFSILCAAIAFADRSPIGLAALAGGLLLGVALARIGLMHTTIEARPDGRYYTPNRWLGLVVTGIFFARLAPRVFTIMNTPPPAPGAPLVRPQQSALTLAVFALLAGYYVAYYAWVMAKAKALAQASVPAPAPAPVPPPAV